MSTHAQWTPGSMHVSDLPFPLANAPTVALSPTECLVMGVNQTEDDPMPTAVKIIINFFVTQLQQ